MRSVAKAVVCASLLGVLFLAAPGTAAAGAPTLVSIVPAMGAQGTTVSVTLTGTNFTDPASLSVTEGGINVSEVIVVDSETITAVFMISDEAALGARDVTVTTSAGKSNSVAFTVTVGAPTLVSIVPASGAQGTTFLVTLTGSHFVVDFTTVQISGFGVTASDINVLSSSSLTAAFTIAPLSPLGGRSVTVTTPGGLSNALSFNVLPGPFLTKIEPAIAARGVAISVSLTGSNFVSGSTQVNVSGSGIAVSEVFVYNPMFLTATLTIDSSAELTARDVTVTVSGEPPRTTNVVKFSVVAAPLLTKIERAIAVHGSTVSVSVTGRYFVNNATSLFVSGSGVTVRDVYVYTPMYLTATLEIDPAAAPVPRDVTVRLGGPVNPLSNALRFSIVERPTLEKINPVFAVRGGAIMVSLTGRDFVAGATLVSVSGSGVTVSSVMVFNPTFLTATFTLDALAEPTSRDVVVTVGGFPSNAIQFTVLTAPPSGPGPTLSSLSLTSGAVGSTLTVDFLGTNFVDGSTSVEVAGGDITVGPITFFASTFIRVPFTIASGSSGSRDIRVATLSGESNPVTFFIAEAPTILTLSPESAAQGATLIVDLLGTNFDMAPEQPTIQVSGEGVTVSGLAVLAPTFMRATLTLAPDATFGSRDVTVSVGAASSNPVTLFIAPGPTLLTLSPQSATQGESVMVDLSGANFDMSPGLPVIDVAGGGVTVSDPFLFGPTFMRGTFVVSGSASPGSHDVTVTVGPNTSNPVTFVVLPLP